MKTKFDEAKWDSLVEVFKKAISAGVTLYEHCPAVGYGSSFCVDLDQFRIFFFDDRYRRPKSLDAWVFFVKDEPKGWMQRFGFIPPNWIRIYSEDEGPWWEELEEKMSELRLRSAEAEVRKEEELKLKEAARKAAIARASKGKSIPGALSEPTERDKRGNVSQVS